MHVARVRVRRPELPRRPRDGRVVARVGFTNAKTGWGGRWKKSNDAPSGSLVAAVAGLAAKTEKKKNADAAFRARDARGGPSALETPTEEAISASDAEIASSSTRWVKGWLSVADLAARGRWDALAEGDQLLREISRGRALRAFSEAPLSFAPTFKLETFDGDAPPANAAVIVTDALEKRNTKNTREYAKKRIPSWCDRVLARSLSPAHACRFRAYASCPGVRTSDHAPVHLSCELDFPSERECRNSEFSSERRDEKEGDVESLARVTLALRIRVSSFRVALEDDEESYLDDRSSPRDADDDANVVVQSSPGEKKPRWRRSSRARRV